MLKSMVRSLLISGSITTTLAKAKAVRSETEKLITIGKRQDQHAQQLLEKQISDKKIVSKVMADYAKTFATREGGYTRIHRVGFRQGDGSEMAKLSLLEK